MLELPHTHTHTADVASMPAVQEFLSQLARSGMYVDDKAKRMQPV